MATNETKNQQKNDKKSYKSVLIFGIWRIKRLKKPMVIAEVIQTFTVNIMQSVYIHTVERAKP